MSGSVKVVWGWTEMRGRHFKGSVMNESERFQMSLSLTLAEWRRLVGYIPSVDVLRDELDRAVKNAVDGIEASKEERWRR